MYNIDDLELEDKPDKGKEILKKTRAAFAEDGHIGAVKTLAASAGEIRSLTPPQWVLLKAEIEPFAKMKAADLAALRKPHIAEVDTHVDEDIAKDKMSRSFCMSSGKGYAYMILEGDNLRAIPSQEMTPLVKLISNEDKLLESKIYAQIHNERKISALVTNVIPNGHTHYAMSKQSNGEWEAVCHVAIEEMLTNQLEKIPKYEMNADFESMVRREYNYMFHIYEYALALKFAFDKTSCIWLREHSDTGKTFFLGAREAKDYIFLAHEEIRENDFVGDGPDKWGKMLFFFVDEATKFSTEMKNAILPYRMNYGGRVELDMPLRILSSANEISDLTNGVDKQIDNRVVNMHFKGKARLRDWLDSNNLDATTAQAMWQKIILTHIKEMLSTWSSADNLQAIASEKIRWFKDQYKTETLECLDDITKEMLNSLLLEVRDKGGEFTKHITMGHRDFKNFIVKDREDIFIKSPKTFFSMMFEEYAPEKKKTFEKSYPNNEALAKLFGTKYATRRAEKSTFKAIQVEIIEQDEQM